MGMLEGDGVSPGCNFSGPAALKQATMRAEVVTIHDAGIPAPSASKKTSVTGVVLAGGPGTRFAGADKGLIQVGGRTLVKRVLEQLLLQVSQIIIVANRNQPLYASYGYRVIPDALPGHEGPLAGVAAGLAAIETSHALFVPVDAARLPTHLAANLLKAQTQRGGAPTLVRSANRTIATCCLLAASERQSVESALASGKRSLDEWLQARNAMQVDFSDWPKEFWGLDAPAAMPALEKALLR